MQHRDIWNWISVREKVVCNVSADGKPESGTHKETTLAGADRIKRIADAVHEKWRKSDFEYQFYTCLAGEKCGNAVRCTVSRI